MEVSSHSLFLLQQLNVQREFGFLCDCTVAIGNVYFKAHRAVLAAFSNYFKMIFIHQSSECIKIQPTDIQPDVFSYLLHIMYTGMCPKQPVDQSRLQEGIKFLHAYQLCRKTGEGAAETANNVVRMSNLYGIQISSQLASKEGSGVPKTTTVSRGAEDGRSSDRGARSHSQLSLAVGLEGVSSDHQASALRCSVASGDDSDISTTHIKQERLEEEEDGEEGPGAGSPIQDSSPIQGLLFKDRPLVLLCPRCGERCSSPEGLREHLFSHALDPARLMEGLSQGGELEAGLEEGPPGTQEQLDAGCLEEALRQSQALANQLAAELRRSRGGGGSGGGGSSPAPSLHSRKRKIACAVCSLRFSHKSQLQEHMYTHTGKPSRYHRYNRLCSQLFQASAHFCDSAAEPGGGAGGRASVGTPIALSEEPNRDTQDNGSSCYSLDSEISQESVDGVPVE
ncbi:zinc finger and BTB domain-containing protein 25 isoform X1 [Simochromis diagramma]|uniref:zinc finger and BTB domain-containing protein 25 isoform X1 n=2 Tax=Simochromis diagramma TaxID=43689 RepID=UPI001A7E5120|nr:zinc finger and BTB domain-containing protein 25 isoform X1 [Simochromis diagramma]XP_039874366.1 zinc finger and BTB domain-containing protein 25 isoform X1 [Simochromis diagramma]XP_039874367.1 zinc finger and BTB domain-containing protein 25 isoform X1 [Simochromis diagramma]